MKEEEGSINQKKQNGTMSSSLHKHISIEDIEANPGKHLKLSSPRSILALKTCGIIEEELQHLSFKEYTQKYFKLKALPMDIQLSRYNFYESRRLDKVNKVKENRNRIALADNSTMSLSNSFLMSNSVDMNSISNSLDNKSDKHLNSTSMTSKDIKELEMMKKKNEAEMLSILHSEISRINMLKEAERKANLQKERFSRSQEERRACKEEEDRTKKAKEDQRHKRQEGEEERRAEQKRDLERKQQEKDRLDQEKERQKEEELKHRKEEEGAKRQLFQAKRSKIHSDNLSLISQKQQLLITRDEDRQVYMEQQRSIKTLTQKHKSQSKKDKIDKNRTSLEEQLRLMQSSLLHKQQLKEMKMDKFEAEHHLQYQKQRDLSLQKQVEIHSVLERNQAMEKQKIIEYDRKQEQIREKKALFEKMVNEEKAKIKKQNEEKAEHIKNTLIKNERQEVARKEYLLSKRESKDDMLMKVMERKKTDSIAKAEELNKKHVLIEENFKSIARVQQFDIEKVKIRQNAKDRRIENFMKMKRYMVDKKKELQSELSKVKQNFLSRFHEATSNKQLDSMTIESFRDLFPNSLSFDRLVQQCANAEQTGLFFTNSGLSRPKRMSHGMELGTLDPDENAKRMRGSNSVRNVKVLIQPSLSERIASVNERVCEYRNKLNLELLMMIQEERQKETEREKVMSSNSNENERRRLEELFGMERGKASMKITRLNE